MIVVKLGGSLAQAGTLRAWLDVVAAAARPVVVVPGGGAFADAVRAAQAAHGFDDRAAHAMALLAMEQMALMFAALAPRLRPAATLAAIRRAAAEGAVPVLAPCRLVLADRALPASWDVTSDAIAARLAERLGARDLVLVKSARAPAGASPEALAAAGLIDPASPAIIVRAGLTIRVIGPGQAAELQTIIGL